MVLKTFNIQEEVYKIFSSFCKENGISMSKQVEKFMRNFINREPKVKAEYLKKLGELEKEEGIPFKNIEELRRIIEG